MKLDDFKLMVENLVEADNLSTELFKTYKIDLFYFDSRHHNVIDVLGQAYFNDDRWFQILEWLFDSESADFGISVEEFYNKYLSNGTTA